MYVILLTVRGYLLTAGSSGLAASGVTIEAFPMRSLSKPSICLEGCRNNIGGHPGHLHCEPAWCPVLSSPAGHLKEYRNFWSWCIYPRRAHDYLIARSQSLTPDVFPLAS
ncbi:hypothetical protein EDD85DRAFT_213465 [Armillaria nabsnona]|nr:hypothetical protein EDD85DRAFT_213465 [Armillaria nabsnona]